MRDEQLLGVLTSKLAESASFRSRMEYCLPDTRAELRKRLIDWSESDKPDTKGIFWISGLAGMGKSAIARTVARHLYERGCLVPSFFFSRDGHADCRDATKFFSTIAVQLTDASAILKGRISKAVSDKHDIVGRTMADQWEYLIKQPLQELEHVTEGLDNVDQEQVNNLKIQPPTLILVVDALDECTKEEHIEDFLSVLEDLKTIKFVRFRILITSRDVPVISDGMIALEENVERFDLSEIPPCEINGDLHNYYENELKLIKERYLRRRKGEKPDLEGWPKEADIGRLVENAQGLFQFAKTACLIIGESRGKPAERLESLLRPGPSGGQKLEKLDQIYLKALQFSIPSADTSLEDEANEFFNRFRQIVGAIVLSFDSLSSWSITSLLGQFDHDTVTETLDRLHSILFVPEEEHSAIRVIHTSFREFLVDKKRCIEKEFQINKEEVHERLFQGCIAVMDNNLKKDICNLRAPGTCVVERKKTIDGSEVVERSEMLKLIAPEVQYACRFWVNHLQGNHKLENVEKAYKFLQQHFLHWLEVLGLTGKISEGVRVITELQSMLTVSDRVRLCYDLKMLT